MKFSQVATVIAIAMTSNGTHAEDSVRGVRGLMADDATDAIADLTLPLSSYGHLSLADLIALLPQGKYLVLFVFAISIYILYMYILYIHLTHKQIYLTHKQQVPKETRETKVIPALQERREKQALQERREKKVSKVSSFVSVLITIISTDDMF